MTCRESRAAARIVELTNEIQAKMDELAKLISDCAHDMDYKVNDYLIEQHDVKMSELSQRLRIRGTSVANMIDVLRSIVYIREHESISIKGTWAEDIKSGNAAKAIEDLSEISKLSRHEISTVVGFFLIPRPK